MRKLIFAVFIALLSGLSGDLQAQIEVSGSLAITAHNAIDAVGNVAYVVGNSSFVTVNLVNPADPSVLGQSSPAVGIMSSVDVAGNYAYCAAGITGLVIFRVADPSTPTWVHSFALSSATLCVDAFDTLVAVATAGNISLVGVRSRGAPHILASFGRPASWIKMDWPSRCIYAGSANGAFSVNIETHIAGADTTFELTARDQFGSGTCSPIALSQPYLNVARINVMTALNAGNLTQAGQYATGAAINALTAGPGVAFVALAGVSVQYLDQRGPTPTFVGSAGIPAQPTGIALAQSGSQPLAVVSHSTGISVLSYTPLDIGEFHRPELPSEIKIEAYPNPFNSLVQLRVTAQHGGLYMLQIHDVLGRVLDTRNIHLIGSETIALDFSTLSAGTYFASLSGANRTAQTKLTYLP
jgi:hypothetical protein